MKKETDNGGSNNNSGEPLEINISSTQEKYILETFPFVHKFVVRKLNTIYSDSVEDLKQKVFLRLWRWKALKSEKDLSEEEWLKLANVVVHNEVARFFREKYTRKDVLLSQMDERTEKTVLSVYSDKDNLEGNSRAEICSLLTLVWNISQTLTLRQKYSYFLQYPDFIVEFISCKCCSIKELAIYFEASEKELAEIINALPLSDEKIGRLHEAKLGEKFSGSKIWEARSKAKAKLASKLKEYISDEELFVKRRN